MEKQVNMYCVYKHINKVNGKVYIGITSQQPEKRWKNGYGYKSNSYFYKAIQKYGWNDGFDHEIIASGLTKDDACEIEIELIRAYDSTNPKMGYNFSYGGECGNNGCYCSTEWLQKMRKALGKPVICLESSVVYDSAVDAENQTGINKGNIGVACRNHTRTAGGLHWCFWDSEWNDFKNACIELNIQYTQCEKCGNLIVRGNTKPKKYCGACSKYISERVEPKSSAKRSKSAISATNKKCRQLSSKNTKKSMRKRT